MAAFLDDLNKALQIFNQQTTALATERAVRDANTQIEEIRQSESNEQEQLDQARLVASQLSADLFSFGAPATTAMGAGQAILNPFQPTQLEQRLKLQKDQQQFIANQAELDRDLKERTLTLKRENALQDKRVKAIESFQKLNKKLIDASDQAKTLDDLLESPVRNVVAVSEVAKRILLKLGGEQRVSDADVLGVATVVSTPDRIRSALKKAAAGKILDKEADLLQAVGEVLKVAMTRRIGDRARGFAKNRSKSFGFKAEELEQDILSEIGLRTSPQGQGGRQTRTRPSNIPGFTPKNIISGSDDTNIPGSGGGF